MSDDLPEPALDTEQVLTPEAPADGGDSTAPAAVDAPATSAPDTPIPAKRESRADPNANRRALIDSLTAEGEPGKRNAEPADDEPPAAAADEEPPKDEQPEERKPAKEPHIPDPDLKVVTNDDIKAMKPGEARRKINRLIQRVNASRPHADVGREIIETCERAGFSAADYKAWVNLGIGLQAGTPEANELFGKIAERAGYTRNPAPAEAPPVLTPELVAWIDKQVTELEITPAVGAALKSKLGTPAKPPAKSEPQQRQPAQQAQPQSPQRDPQWIAARDRAMRDIDTFMSSVEKKYGSAFATIEKTIHAELQKRAGRHPDAWLDIVRSVVAQATSKLQRPKQPQTSLPASQATTSAKTVYKSERERVIHQHTGALPSPDE